MGKRALAQVSCLLDVKNVSDVSAFTGSVRPSIARGVMSSKYRATKTLYNGVLYDSKLEAAVAERLDELRPILDEETPHVIHWARQIEFKLIPKRGKERAIIYKADFLVGVEKGENTDSYIIEVKGFSTPVWRLKRRLFLHLYPEADLRVVKSVKDVDIAILEDWFGD